MVAAGHQTAGRGRLGRSWASAPGRSLLFSLVLRPPLPPDRAPVVSLLAAASMVEACPRTPEGRVTAKWPNDLVIGDRKIAGILPEARVEGATLRYLVVGIGVNVSMTPDDLPGELAATATSLAPAGGGPSPEEILAAFLQRFRAAYHPVDPDFPLHAVVRYRTVCATIGRRVLARTVAGTDVEGVATEVRPDGSLVVESGTARHVVAFGELVHLR